jgi:hypothetical protein
MTCIAVPYGMEHGLYSRRPMKSRRSPITIVIYIHALVFRRLLRIGVRISTGDASS